MSTFGHNRRELKQPDELVDEDALLASLSCEELQELERELAYLDDNLPIGMRQRDQTNKTPTGSFDRHALRRYWEEENVREMEEGRVDCNDGQEGPPDKSREERVPVTAIEAGEILNNDKKIISTKEKKVQNVSSKNNTKADEMEKKDECKKPATIRIKSPNKNCLAKVSKGSETRLDLNQNLTITSEKQGEKNPTIIDTTLEQILSDDPTVSEVNLNNIEDISQEALLRFAEALCTNTHVTVFSLANTHADDRVAFAVSKMLRENQSVKNLNIESNFVSGRGILALIAALQHNSSLVELRFHNQRHICGGKVEMEMVTLLRENHTLLKLGYQFDLPGPRMSATSILTRNQDRQRQRRLREKQQESPQEVTGQISGSFAENRQPKKPAQPSKTVVNQNRSPTIPIIPTATLESPTRKIAEMVKQQEGSNGVKSQVNLRKPLKSKKLKNGANEKESADILKDLRNSLKPSWQQKRRSETERELPRPQRSGRDDLMEAIRGTSLTALKPVDPSEA